MADRDYPKDFDTWPVEERMAWIKKGLQKLPPTQNKLTLPVETVKGTKVAKAPKAPKAPQAVQSVQGALGAIKRRRKMLDEASGM